MQLKIDNEFKSLIPALKKEESELLEASILEEGCRDALIVWGDIVVDGHNRYEICNRNGLLYSINTIDLDTREDAILWIIKNQLGRRNLEAIDKIALAEKSREIVAMRAKERQVAQLKQGDQNPVRENLPQREAGKTRDQLAAILGVSGRTYDALLRVEKNGVPELVSAVRDKVVGVTTAAKLCALPKSEQVELVKKGKKAMIAKFNEITPRKPKSGKKEDEPEVKKDVEITPKVSWAMDYAEMAISQLKRIEKNDPLRVQALKQVISWAKKQTKI